MSNRLTQIATRTGDNGTTGLGDNTRVSKDSLRVHAMGDVDELNSNIGVLLCEDMASEVRALLVEVQHQLFNLGGELSIPGFELLKPEAVATLDTALEKYNASLPRLQEFILPAGTRAAALAHVCRTVARRAERAVVSLDHAETLKDTPRQHRHGQARYASQLTIVVVHVDVPDLRAAPDVHRPRDAGDPAAARALEVVGIDVQPDHIKPLGQHMPGGDRTQGFSQHHGHAAIIIDGVNT
jgi:cob(I)alamin adenosyltransferase